MSAHLTSSSAAGNRREQVGWYFYDWANSAFSTTVAGVFLGPYLTTVTRQAADAHQYVYPLGIPVYADSFYSYVLSLSVVLQVFFLPVLGAMADYSPFKKWLLAIFAFIGALATSGLIFLQGDNYLLGGGLFLLANLSFGASIVFYNSFLPEIAAPGERNRVSAQGWAMGYLGGGLLLLLNLLLFMNRQALGLADDLAVRLCLASAGVWWALFTLIPLSRLRTRAPLKRLPPGGRYLRVGVRQLAHTFAQLPSRPHALLFLIAYLLYNDGIQTVIAESSQFGNHALGMNQTDLALLFLMVQFVAFGGALLFNAIAQRLGTKNTIWGSLIIWTAAVVYAYAFLTTSREYFLLGAVIALVLGGSQALSRSLYSHMIPKGQEAEFFGIYEISERGTSWLGTTLFGLALQFSKSYQVAILSVGVFFLAGLILLPFVNVRRAIEEAGNPVPGRV
jgi:MFS transporter, UMF1 family